MGWFNVLHWNLGEHPVNDLIIANERVENLKIKLDATKQSPAGPEKNERLASLRARLQAAREQAKTLQQVGADCSGTDHHCAPMG